MNIYNWSGNRVTCRDWFHKSQEGLQYLDSEFSADTNSRSEAYSRCDFLRSAQFTEDAGPTAHPVQPSEYQEISNFYTLTIYEKGAEVVRMIRTLWSRIIPEGRDRILTGMMGRL